MAAQSTVEAPAVERPPLRCNCTLQLVRPSDGELVSVRARAWDCPSCGLDNRRRIAEMCGASMGLRMITLTFDQPLYSPDQRECNDLRPERHRWCDPGSHVWTNPRTGRQQWRLVSTCPRCCRWVSARVALFRKRLRRRFGLDVAYLWAREDHPTSGAVHLHVAVSGLPAMSRRSRPGRWVKRAWAEVGGGWLDLGDAYPPGSDRAGWYVGKYLAKRHDQRMARGHRRWSRTQNFAPSIRMRPAPPALLIGPRPEPPERVGWLHPLTAVLTPVRVFEPG